MTDITKQRATSDVPQAEKPKGSLRNIGAKLSRAVLTRRELLLLFLLAVVVACMFALSFGGYMTGPYTSDYMSSSLVDAVPVAMLALAQLFVMASGRGGIDLSVGAMVSLSSMVFGFVYQLWTWPLPFAIVAVVCVGALLGLVNGFLVAICGFPALIATLATYYAFTSVALVVSEGQPISGDRIRDLFSMTSDWEIPLIGSNLPNIPLGVVTFLIPTVVVAWLLVQRTTFGRRLFAIGTNDTAARWVAVNVSTTRMWAYVLSGAISGLVAVYLTSEFASARPDAGNSGNGLALPSIAIAVLGGIAITGGVARVSGVVLAAILVTWLNAGLLLLFAGNQGTQMQLLALGSILILASLFNAYTTRKYGGIR